MLKLLGILIGDHSGQKGVSYLDSVDRLGAQKSAQCPPYRLLYGLGSKGSQPAGGLCKAFRMDFPYIIAPKKVPKKLINLLYQYQFSHELCHFMKNKQIHFDSFWSFPRI